MSLKRRTQTVTRTGGMETVREIPVDPSRRIVEVHGLDEGDVPDVDEAIVFLKPDPDDDRDSITSHVEFILGMGAVSVKLVPPEVRSNDVPASDVTLPDVSQTLREVVQELVDECPLDIRDDVRDEVERAMSEAGL